MRLFRCTQNLGSNTHNSRTRNVSAQWSQPIRDAILTELGAVSRYENIISGEHIDPRELPGCKHIISVGYPYSEILKRIRTRFPNFEDPAAIDLRWTARAASRAVASRLSTSAYAERHAFDHVGAGRRDVTNASPRAPSSNDPTQSRGRKRTSIPRRAINEQAHQIDDR